MLARGANANAADNLGNTPLLEAIGMKQMSCFAALLSSPASSRGRAAVRGSEEAVRRKRKREKNPKRCAVEVGGLGQKKE